MSDARTHVGVGVITMLACVLACAVSDAPRARPEIVAERVGRSGEAHGGGRRHRSGRDHAEPAPTPPSELPARAEACPDSMVRVEGEFCPDVHQRCEEMTDDESERCIRFRKPTRCGSRHRQPMNFCIDRYEWPNRAGAVPQVLHSWNDAERLCRSTGRRLCTEDEWTLACEGPAMLPYPFGYARDDTACNIDHENLPFERDVITGPDRARAEAEASRVSQARPSGASARCVSPYGVYDMTGNVDEWAVSHEGRRFRSTLKGGYWGRVRARCRPGTYRHDESFRYYQIGFRCCADLASPPEDAPASPPRLARHHGRRHHGHHHHRHRHHGRHDQD